MKNKKGFTLIELLAIIVILAIIAVITVPIILNVIENSKKGAAIDSAYGYKDSIQQYYVLKSVNGEFDEVLSGEKTKLISELGDISVNGTKPSEGWVKINKGQVVDYSLKFGDYMVSLDLDTNKPISTKNGELKEQPLPTMYEMCPGCVFGFKNNGVSNKIGQALPSDYGYSNDYKSLGTVFLGQIVEDNVIKRSFVCGNQNNKYFCLEVADASKRDYNIRILNQFFTGEGMICSSNGSGRYICQDHASSDKNTCNVFTLRADIGSSDVHLYDDGIKCSIEEDGYSYFKYHCDYDSTGSQCYEVDTFSYLSSDTSGDF